MADLGSASGRIDVDANGAIRAIQNVKRTVESLDGIGANALSGLGKADARIGSLENRANAFEQKWQGVGLGFTGFGAAVFGGFSYAASGAIEFEQAMANVNSIAGLSESELAGLSDQVLQLAQVSGKGPVELAAGLYDIQSSGFGGADAINVLTASVNAANAGMTDTATSSRAITSVLNAYGLSADQAGNVSDVLFQTVNSGVVTFDQLANQMGEVLPIAAALGVPITELGAAYTVMTKQGINAAQAETYTANVLKAAANPTKALTKAVQEHGYASAEDMIKTEGLAGFLSLLQEETGGSSEAMSDLLGNQEAVTGATALLSGGIDGFNDVLDDMNGAMGDVNTTEDALAAQTDTTAFALKRFGSAFQTLRIRIGELISPLIRFGAEIATSLINAFLGMSQGVQTFVAAIAGVAGALSLAAGGFILLYPLYLRSQSALLKLGQVIPKLINPLRGLASVIRIVSVAMRALLLANPAVLALVALAAGAIYAYTHFEPFRKIVDQVAGTLKDFATGKALDFLEEIGEALGDALDFAEDFIGGIDGVADAFSDLSLLFTGFRYVIGLMFDGLAEKAGVFGGTVERIGDIISTGLGVWSNLFEAFGNLIRGDFSAAWTDFGQAAQLVFEQIGNLLLLLPQLVVDAFQAIPWSGIASAAWGAIQDAIGAMWDGLQTGISLAWTAIQSIDWSDFISGVALSAYATLLDWAEFVGGKIADFSVWLAGKINDIPWTTIIGKLGDLATWLGGQVSDIPWSAILGTIADFSQWLAGKVSDIPWTTIIGKIADFSVWLADKVGDIPWSTIIGKLADFSGWLADRVSDIPWATIVGKLADFSKWLGGRVSDIPWSTIIGKIADFSVWLAGVVSDIPWATLLGKIADLGVWLAGVVSDIPWTTILGKIEDLGRWLGGQVSDVPWTTIIGKLQDFGTWLAGIVTNIPWPSATDILNAIPWPDMPSIEWPSASDILSAITGLFSGEAKAAPANSSGGSAVNGGVPAEAMDAAEAGRDPGGGSLAAGEALADTLARGILQDTINPFAAVISSIEQLGRLVAIKLPEIGSLIDTESRKWPPPVNGAVTAMQTRLATGLGAMLASTGSHFGRIVATSTRDANQMETGVGQSFALMASQSATRMAGMAAGLALKFLGIETNASTRTAGMARSVGVNMVDVATSGERGASRFAGSLASGFGRAARSASFGVGQIAGAASSLIGRLYDIGINAGSALANALSSMGARVGAAAASLVRQANIAAAAAAAISSPSKVWLRFGEMMAGALPIAFDDMLPRVLRASAGLAEQSGSAFRRALGRAFSPAMIRGAVPDIVPAGIGGVELASTPAVYAAPQIVRHEHTHTGQAAQTFLVVNRELLEDWMETVDDVAVLTSTDEINAVVGRS